MVHVFLIDDDTQLVEMNKLALEAKGHKVSVAYTGQEAWNWLQKNQPDIVVLDVMMEDFTAGFEIAHDIGIKFPKLPIIMLTGVHEYMSKDWQFSEEGDKNWLPVYKFVEKPIAPTKLITMVEETLQEAKTSAKDRSAAEQKSEPERKLVVESKPAPEKKPAGSDKKGKKGK